MKTGQIFKSEKGLLISIVTWALFISGISFMCYFIFTGAFSFTDIVITLWITLLSAYYLFVWFNTSYSINKDALNYRVGFSKGSIPVKSIRKIEFNSKPTLGVHYTLHLKGITIYYNRWDELYLTPIHKDLFVKALLSVNNSIALTGCKATDSSYTISLR